LKILYVSQSFFPSTGGVSYYLLWLGRRLAEKGHSPIFVNLKPSKRQSEEVIEGMKVYRTPKEGRLPQDVVSGYARFKELILKVFHGKEDSVDRLFNKHLFGFEDYVSVNKAFEIRIRELVQTEKPDLIHIHDFQLLLLGQMLDDLGIPLYFTWHIPFTEEVHRAWREFIIKYMQFYKKNVFSTKPYINAALKSGLAWNRVACIPPFIDVEKPKSEFRKKYGIPKDEKLIICVARMDKLKGQHVLIEAASRLDLNYRIAFIGNGSFSKEVLKVNEKEEYHKELKSKCDSLGISNKVIFTGAISRDMLMAAYSECDVVVLPSIQEGFGLAITEGMAFGKPVIGTATGGIPTQIWPGSNGYLVEPNNPASLGEAIRYILSNEEVAKKMGEWGRRAYQSGFSSERGLNDHLALYGLL